ncbi:MAG: DUF952 domain-containing protein [Rhodospirillales bacterium]
MCLQSSVRECSGRRGFQATLLFRKAFRYGGAMNGGTIYHICKRAEWQAATDEGVYRGSSQDAADGFIHFSSREQVRASAAKHRAGQDGLVLLSVDPDLLGEELKWEASRGGMLFPHLYGPLPCEAVVRVDGLPLGDDGLHVFPGGFPGFEEVPS